jgi:hypothetical protein
VSIQEEIHKALNEIKQKTSQEKELSDKDLQTLFLTSLIEEES